MRRHALEVGIEAIEALRPHLAVLLEPVRGRCERSRFEPARTLLAFAAARDEPGSFEHLQVLRDRRARERKRFREVLDGSVAIRQTRKDRPPRRIGKRREDR